MEVLLLLLCGKMVRMVVKVLLLLLVELGMMSDRRAVGLQLSRG